jgi:DNA-directed RNA polymerase subunit alpha
MKFLEPLQLPDTVQVDEQTYSPIYGKFEIGPLEQGFGTTIGNTLRRVLLSSIQGAAVKYVKIEGLHHEYAPIPGTTSDYIDLILKLKKLVVKSDSINEEKLILEHKGKGIITAAEIQETANVRIINKDLELLELTEDEDFRMELWIGIGRGYQPAEKHDTEDITLQGIIPVDCIYSPVNKVNFSVENQRVGEIIDYDKLLIEIFTDGSIDPKEALYLSAKILRDLYDKVVLFETEPQYIVEVEMDPELERMEKILDKSVNDLELTVRCSNCLAAAKIDTIGDLVSKTENEMLKFKNFGKKSLEEITKLLDEYDLSLGMNVSGIKAQIEEAKKRVTIK